jgi:hypothetical protein
MHENPGASEEEQELAQTDRLEEEEEMRGGQSPADAEDDEDDEGEQD